MPDTLVTRSEVPLGLIGSAHAAQDRSAAGKDQLLAHKYAFDEEVICALLARSGFVDVRIETYQTGRDPDLLIDDTSLSASAHGGAWSLFVEAASPAPSARAGRRSGEER